MRVDEPKCARPRRLDRKELGAGLAHVRRTPTLRRLVAASALAVIALGLSESVLFAVVDDGLHRPAPFLGVVLAIQGIGAVAAGLAAPALMNRAGERLACACGMAIAAAGLPMLATSSIAVVVGGAAFFGAGVSWIVIGAVTLLQRSTPAHLQGRTYAVLEMTLAVPQAAAVATGALLVGLVDHRLLLIAMATLMALAATNLARPPAAALKRRGTRSPGRRRKAAIDEVRGPGCRATRAPARPRRA